MNRARKLAWLAALGSLAAWAQNGPGTGTPARVLVSVGHYYNGQAPVLDAGNVTVTQFAEPLPVLSVTARRGPIEIFILIDQCSTCEVGSKFEELNRFVRSRPAGTNFGVAYIHGGKLQIAAAPGADREGVLKSLNAPQGSEPANPFDALADLIGQWTPDGARRVVLMISNGLDPKAAGDASNASAEAAIEKAERGGVQVFAIYHPNADYLSADWAKLNAGQVQLAHVAVETGGEAYFVGLGPLPLLGPFLADISDHLANQYTVVFTAKPESAGSLLDVNIGSTNPDVEIMAPAKVWVPGPGSGEGLPGK